MKLTVEASGAADPETVWDRYVHPARWHGPFGVGVAFEILRVDHDKRCWAWRVTVAGITLVLGHDVFAQASGSSTTLDITGPAPVVIGYAPIARIALGRLVRYR